MSEVEQTVVPVPSDEIDLGELLGVLWAGKWLIGGVTFAASVIAVIFALMMPNVYRAEALLAPNDSEGAGGLSALAAQYGGLASLAGINLGGGSADKTTLGLEVLRSRKFISEFIERHDILVPVMAAKDWDAASGELEIDSTIFDSNARKWVREAKPPRKEAPSSQEAYKVFSDLMSVSNDKKTGFVTISIEFFSPTIAKQWVDWLVEDINSTIMQRDVAEAEQAIAYLNEQIESTSLSDLQNVFFKLIEDQTKTVMLAKVSSEYMFRTIDPAIAPELKSKPKRSLIAIVGMLLGGMFGVVIVAFRHGLRAARN